MTRERTQRDVEYDVVVVGGGPSGSSAAVFTARYGLDTLVFDRGNAALRRCAYLENYLGFPGGVDVDTFYRLMHAHVEETGAELRSEMVTRVDRTDDGERFVVETNDGSTVTTRYVLASAWYDGEYLRPLGGEAMFETHEHDGEAHDHFDPEYADADGRTPVEGLYVGAPAGERSVQTIVAAGHGAHVARTLLEDHRSDAGYPDGVTPHYDWLRRESEFTGEWGTRDRWREWYEAEAEGSVDTDDQFVERREQYIDDAFETKLTDEEAEARTRRGRRRLVESLGVERVLSVIDPDDIRAHLDAE